MAELPEALVIVRDTDEEPDGGGWIVDCDCEGPLSYSLEPHQPLYTADQLRDYAAAKVAEERERHKRDVEKLRRALGDIAEYAHKTDDVRRWCAEALSEKGYE